MKHFELHGLHEVLRLAEKNYFMTSLDIKDANYLVLAEK